MWRGLVRGVVRCGVVWCGAVWCGAVWCGVWCGAVCGVVWCGVVQCGNERRGRAVQESLPTSLLTGTPAACGLRAALHQIRRCISEMRLEAARKARGRSASPTQRIRLVHALPVRCPSQIFQGKGGIEPVAELPQPSSAIPPAAALRAALNRAMTACDEIIVFARD